MLLNSDKVFAGFIRVKSLLRTTFHGWAAPRGFTKIFLCILVVIGGAIINSDVFSKTLGFNIFGLEKDKKAPVDYGFGPGAGVGPARPNLVLGQTPAIPRSIRLVPKAAKGTVPIGGGGAAFLAPRFLADHTASHGAFARRARLELRHR